MKREVDQSVITKLRNLCLQGTRRELDEEATGLGLGEIEGAFPNGVFPMGVTHEFISTSSETAASTSGFLTVLLGKLLDQNGHCLWASTQPRRSVFPPALADFGIRPEQILFVDTKTAKDTLWVIEEALKCEALTAVVGEITELSFNESRRLQLAVERSKVTGLIHRFRPKTENVTACVSRWKISPLASAVKYQQPGLGFPQWNVELLKVKNGMPGRWQIQWSSNGLEYLAPEIKVIPLIYEKQTG